MERKNFLIVDHRASGFRYADKDTIYFFFHDVISDKKVKIIVSKETEKKLRFFIWDDEPMLLSANVSIYLNYCTAIKTLKTGKDVKQEYPEYFI